MIKKEPPDVLAKVGIPFYEILSAGHTHIQVLIVDDVLLLPFCLQKRLELNVGVCPMPRQQLVASPYEFDIYFFFAQVLKVLEVPFPTWAHCFSPSCLSSGQVYPDTHPKKRPVQRFNASENTSSSELSGALPEAVERHQAKSSSNGTYLTTQPPTPNDPQLSQWGNPNLTSMKKHEETTQYHTFITEIGIKWGAFLVFSKGHIGLDLSKFSKPGGPEKVPLLKVTFFLAKSPYALNSKLPTYG